MSDVPGWWPGSRTWLNDEWRAKNMSEEKDISAFFGEPEPKAGDTNKPDTEQRDSADVAPGVGSSEPAPSNPTMDDLLVTDEHGNTHLRPRIEPAPDQAMSGDLASSDPVEGEGARETLERGAIVVGMTEGGCVAVWRYDEQTDPISTGDAVIPTILAALASQAPAGGWREEHKTTDSSGTGTAIESQAPVQREKKP